MGDDVARVTATVHDLFQQFVEVFHGEHLGGVVFAAVELPERFKDELTFWNQHAAFVEVYSTAQIPRSEIPEVQVTFGYPRVNGQPPKLKSARVVHPSPGGRSGSPDCAKAEASGSSVVVSVGPIFPREDKERQHALDIKMPDAHP